MHQVSVKLEPQRAVGGKLAAGDTVGVFLSIEDKDVTSTQLKLHKVLVTAVEGGPAPAAEGGSAQAQPAQETMTVTLAAQAADVAKIVFTAEHGTIWLSAEPANAPVGSAPVLTKGNLYK
jgi:pilus assembly protein CpaB